jgi:hypothetical protein
VFAPFSETVKLPELGLIVAPAEVLMVVEAKLMLPVVPDWIVVAEAFAPVLPIVVVLPAALSRVTLPAPAITVEFASDKVASAKDVVPPPTPNVSVEPEPSATDTVEAPEIVEIALSEVILLFAPARAVLAQAIVAVGAE